MNTLREAYMIFNLTPYNFCIPSSILISKTWNDKLCDTQMQMGWDNSWFHSMVKIASRVGSAHNKATYLSADEIWIIDFS